MGYELAGVCENGREAREFLQKQDVDVVLTDICMPFMDGIALSKYIHEEHADTKVLILSGYDEFEYAQSAIKNTPVTANKNFIIYAVFYRGALGVQEIIAAALSRVVYLYVAHPICDVVAF